MEDWMAYVSTRSLERGCDYFESGCVRAVEHRADGWHATVSGGSDYAVFVPASLDPREAQCTCPHYADGNICKHIAAALIAIERRRNADEEGKGSEDGNESIEDIVMRTNADDLRALHAAHSSTLFRILPMFGKKGPILPNIGNSTRYARKTFCHEKSGSPSPRGEGRSRFFEP